MKLCTKKLRVAVAVTVLLAAGAWAQYDACYDNPDAAELDLCMEACTISEYPWCGGGGGNGVVGTWNCGVGVDSAKVVATLSDGTLTVSGNGPMKYSFESCYYNPNVGGNLCSYISPPWVRESRETITSVIVENGVTSVMRSICSDCENLTSVTIGNGVTSIEDNAFSGCTGLTSITIPNSVTSLSGFKYTGLTSITIPNSVDTIRYQAFSGCTGLTSITIPNSVKYLSGFDSCTNLKSITIPNSVTSLSGFNNTGLTSITIPNSVTSLSGFNNTGLTSITIPNSVTSLSGFSNTGLTSLIIPNSVETIGYRAFSGCTGLTSITIPNSVNTIEGYAFSDCKSVRSLNIGSGVLSIGGFGGLDSLKSFNYGGGQKAFFGSGFSTLDTLIIGNKIDSIPKKYFTYNKNLTYVSIGSGAIRDSAFFNLPKLSTLILGDSVKSIGAGAFRACSSLTSVSVPKSAKYVGAGAFSGCAKLAFAAVASDSIAASAFSGLANLTTLVLGSGVKSIGQEAFRGCTKLMTLTVPDSVKRIGASAFSGCARLQSVSVGNGADSIGNSAFEGCSGVTSMIIGNRVASIGSRAFAGCTGLASLTSLASDPPAVYVGSRTDSTFLGVDRSTCKLKVQQVDMGMYRAAAGWKDFSNIEAVTFPNVSVMDITGVPERFSVNEALVLTGVVTPSTATNKAIEWSVAGASIAGTNFTGAVIEDGNKLSAAFPGTVVVRAAIANGAITGVDFERYFFITVEPEPVSVAVHERVIPSAVSVGAAAVVAPVGKLSAGLSAGPNPAGALGGAVVRFFRQGVRVEKASLLIYDAAGNVVRKIAVSDNAVGVNSNRRVVGSWDLTDAKGRPVSAGTYLVRGTVKASGGKTERVSLVVGVR